MEQDLGAMEMQQGSHESLTGMAHAARFPGRVGPTCSSLVAPISSIFVSLDASWPKTIYKKGRPAGRGREYRRNIETRNRSLGDRRLEGKLQRGIAGVISIPSNDSTFVAMMKGE
jgi:hypothetical protein